MANLPEILCREMLADERFIHIRQDWKPPSLELFGLYPSRRGLTAAGLQFLRQLKEHMQRSYLRQQLPVYRISS